MNPRPGRTALLALLLLESCLAPACGSPPGVLVMTPDELTALAAGGEAPLILDVRDEDEYAAGHVPGAVNVPFASVDERVAELEPFKERGVVTYCETGVRSARAQRALAQAGFTRLWQLEGDLSAWRSAGRELSTGEEPE